MSIAVREWRGLAHEVETPPPAGVITEPPMGMLKRRVHVEKGTQPS